jgi:AraC-like DNA-binding protein
MNIKLYSNIGNVTFDNSTYSSNYNVPFSIQRIEYKKGYKGKKNSGRYTKLLYTRNGPYESKAGNVCCYPKSGDLLVVHQYTNYEIKTPDCTQIELIECKFLPNFLNKHMKELECKHLNLDIKYLNPFFSQCNSAFTKCLSDSASIEVERSLLEMLTLFEEKGNYYELSIKYEIMIKERLLELILLIIKSIDVFQYSDEQKFSKRNIELVKSVIKYLDDNYRSKIRVEDLSRKAMLSRAYFSRIFKALTGITCINYINGLRVKKAIELLKNSEMNITEVCYQSGFEDTAYFCKLFKKTVGISPKEYRNFSKLYQ